MKRLISLILSIVMVISTFSTMTITANASTYEEQLRNKGFPQSYIDGLVKLHEQYPEWNFVPLFTGLKWSDAVNGERKTHKQQLIEKVTSLYPTSYFCKCSDCYKNGSYVIKESPNWVSASQEAVEHYMDPRNWFDEKHIFQFESTAYDSNQTQSGVEAILKGTWMYNSTISYKDADGKTQTINKKYSAVIMSAAKEYDMSAYYLASKIVQEVGASSPTAGGASGTVSGYKGIYNYYNIGAYTGAVDGLKWASATSDGYYTNCNCNMRKSATTSSDILTSVPANTKVTYISTTSKQSDGYTWHKVTYNNKTGYIRSDLIDKKTAADTYGRPWTDPEKSITYGAKWIANNFKTQTSGYLQKFNVNPKSSVLHSNEYMANVAAAVTEAEKTYKAYANIGKLSTSKTFSIPVFDDMPNEYAPKSTTLLSAIGINNGFDLEWEKINDATGYQVQYATKSDFSNGAIVYAGPKDTTSMTITGRAADTKYYVRARSYKKLNGEYHFSVWSKAVAVTTKSVSSAPSATSVTSAKPAAYGFTVSWNRVSDTRGYQLQYATKSDFSNAATIYAGPTDTTSITVNGRALNTKYYVRVRTYKYINSAYVWGDWSDGMSVVTPSKPTATAFTADGVQALSNGFNLSWSKTDDTTGYQVQYATTSSFSNGATAYAGPKNATSTTITGRASNTKYYVRIRTYKNIDGSYVWGDWSASVSVKTLDKNAPLPTAFTSVKAISNGFELKWTKIDDTTGYQVQYATKSDFSNGAIVYAGPKDTTSKSITGRAKDTKYYVRIRTYKKINDSYVWGSWSSAKGITTL